MKNRCIRCGRVIPKGQDVCENCNRSFIGKLKKIAVTTGTAVVVVVPILWKFLKKLKIR